VRQYQNIGTDGAPEGFLLVGGIHVPVVKKKLSSQKYVQKRKKRNQKKFGGKLRWVGSKTNRYNLK